MRTQTGGHQTGFTGTTTTWIRGRDTGSATLLTPWKICQDRFHCCLYESTSVTSNYWDIGYKNLIFFCQPQVRNENKIMVNDPTITQVEKGHQVSKLSLMSVTLQCSIYLKLTLTKLTLANVAMKRTIKWVWRVCVCMCKCKTTTAQSVQ